MRFLTRLIERPPALFRLCFPGTLFRARGCGKTVYLTFDDGPVPEATPAVLDILRRHGVKATFFMVGDNVRKYPEMYRAVLADGHAVGNHTMHHLQGIKVTTRRYLDDVAQADALIGSRLVRPPHGVLRIRQRMALARRYRLVMYDLVTRDYSRHTDADRVFHNVRRLARPGSIIVFHDSVKSLPRTLEALPRAIEWLREQGYEFGVISENEP